MQLSADDAGMAHVRGGAAMSAHTELLKTDRAYQAWIASATEFDSLGETIGYFDTLNAARRAARMACRDKPDMYWLWAVDRVEVNSRDWKDRVVDYTSHKRWSQWGGVETLS